MTLVVTGIGNDGAVHYNLIIEARVIKTMLHLLSVEKTDSKISPKP